MSRAPPPPKGAAPVSKEVVDAVRRKMAPPPGPPPAGMKMNFAAPKHYETRVREEIRDDDQYEDENDEDEDEDDGSDEGRRSYGDEDDIPDSPHRNKYNDDREFNGQRSSQDNRHNASTRGYDRDDSSQDYKHQQKHNAELAEPKVSKEKSSSKDTGDESPIGMAAKAYGKLDLYNFQSILRATYRELKTFSMTPCPPGKTIRCYVERVRSGLNMLSPYYSVCADLEDGTGRELMVCRKIMKSRTAHYIFSLKSEDLWRKREQRSRLFLGKLRVVSGTDYVLYDNGICKAPEDPDGLWDEDDAEYEAQAKGTNRQNLSNDSKGDKASNGLSSASEEVSLFRKELAVIHFNSKARPASGTLRGTEICIPIGHPTGAAEAKGSQGKASFNIMKPFDKIRESGKQNELYAKQCLILHERASKYDPLSSVLVDFKGRANMPSVKNCQFVLSNPYVQSLEQQMKLDAEKDFILELGKATEDCFNMDYRYPLSLLQAFAISIARFDAKINW